MEGTQVENPHGRTRSTTVPWLKRCALVVCAAVAASLTAAAPTQAADAIMGCPSGYFCIYPENMGYNNGQPSHRYYKYGWYNLSNMYGIHAVVNNQFPEGGAWEALVDLCDRYGGRWHDYREIIQHGQGWSGINFTPINSIKLYLWGGSAGYANGCVQV